MHLVSTFCEEQAGQVVPFNFITFGMKLHLCFRLRPDGEKFHGSRWRICARRPLQKKKKKSPNQMQMEAEFKCNAGWMCNWLD